MSERKKDDVYFENRSKERSKLLIILAGYKEAIWDTVFERLNKYIDYDIDVCVVTSGLLSVPLIDLCERNNWSYLSTEVNNLCLAQNLCISLFPTAEFIYKMDEDMFVTKGVFRSLFERYNYCVKHEFIQPSIVVPVINVNCVTYRLLLERFNLIEDFKHKTGFEPWLTDGLHHHKEILESPEVAKYMWTMFDIDEYEDIPFAIKCPTRFSIGLMLMPRSTWEAMGKFPVDLDNPVNYKRIGLGEDEKALCVFAMKNAMPIMIDLHSLVGHLGYGPQTEEMLKFYEKNKHLFSLKK